LEKNLLLRVNWSRLKMPVRVTKRQPREDMNLRGIRA
jgi:hypothetical protein